MIIDFDNLEETILPNFKGGEKEMFAHIYADTLNKILYGKLEPGASIGVHTHDTGSEIIYLVKGSGYVMYEGEKFPITPGLCHYCPKGHSHCLVNDGNEDMEFFAVVAEQ